jgi:hypothetical protein
MSVRLRALVLTAGCVSGIAGVVAYGLYFGMVPAVLVLGAVVQPYSPRPGRLLIAMGALLVTLYVGIFVAPVVVSMMIHRTPYEDASRLLLLGLYACSVVLVGWCDAALVVNARRIRFTEPLEQLRVFPSVGDWIVWVTAACITFCVLFVLSQVLFAFRNNGRRDIVGLSLLVTVAVLCFDAMFIFTAARMWREFRVRR